MAVLRDAGDAVGECRARRPAGDRLAADEDSTLVDMRSASRYGRHDLGDNAARIVAFFDALDREVAGRTGTAPDQ